MMASKDKYSKNIAPSSYKTPGDTIGKYVGQEKLFSPKYKAERKSGMGPSPAGAGAGYAGLNDLN